MGEEVATENGSKSQIKLDTEISNGIKHAIATLDVSNSGEVSKLQLQAVVANVCQAIKVPFCNDDLDNFLPEKEEISVTEFLDFLESILLVKGKKLNPKEMDELSWVLVGQKYEDDPHMLSKREAFKLWLVFKKLDVAGELHVDVEELCIVLEKFVRGIGVQWNEQHLIDFAEDGALTFWKFLDCLERKFLIGVDKSVLREGLQELNDFILDEVTKTGFLNKKGHGVMFQSQKSRWFVLKPDKLTYYVSSGFREKKGDVILNNETKVTSIPDKGSNKCRFLVTCGLTKKEYEQTAPDQRTKQAWMADIQRAIDCFGGLTPLKRDLLARKAKRDEDRARKAEEERKRREQDDLLDEQRKEIDLLKKRKEEIERHADEEKAMLDAEIKRREELEELQRKLQQLLEDQKRAREEDEKVRAAKERLLEEERIKREQLEALRLQQQEELQNEKMQKEELIEKQKEQERILGEERKRLQHLEEERMKAEEAAKAAKSKLDAAETAAKNAAEQAKDRVRQLKTSIGLKGTVGPKVDPLVSHRGKGAFTLEEFLNRATEWSGLPEDEERPRAGSTAPHVDELVKASATPASNQNIPEFLKKAAAWSGLNPDTYLEGAEAAQGKKDSPPPKVAAKPSKPLPTAEVNEQRSEGEQASTEGEEGPQEDEQGPQEDEKRPQEDERGPQEDEQGPQEDEQGSPIEKAEESEVKVERKVEDNEVTKEENGVLERAPVSNVESEVSDDLKEENNGEGLGATARDEEGPKVEAVEVKEGVVADSTDGYEAANVNEKGSEEQDEKSEEVVEGDLKAKDEVKGSEEDKDVSEVVCGNDGGSDVKDTDNECPTEGGDPEEAAVANEEKLLETEENDGGEKTIEDVGRNEPGDENTENRCEIANCETVETGDTKEAQADETSSEVNDEKRSSENSEVNETNEGEEEKSKNDEKKESDVCPAAEKEVDIVENGVGESSEETTAEYEQSNSENTKCELSEKCGAKPDENSDCNENVEAMNS